MEAKLCENLKKLQVDGNGNGNRSWIYTATEMEKCSDAADNSVLFFPWLCLFVGRIRYCNMDGFLLKFRV